MKKLIPFLGLFLVSILLSGCASGEKAYDRGDFHKATLQALKRLRSSPEHEKSAIVLRSAYPDAVNWSLREIQLANQSGDTFRNEILVYEYGRLNELADEIHRTPAAKAIIGEPKDFHAEEAAAADRAAAVRAEMASTLLASGFREAAQEAVGHLETAIRLQPDNPALRVDLDRAMGMATTHVVVQPVLISIAGMDQSGFAPDLLEHLRRKAGGRFLRFYTPEELAGLQPDQVIQCHMEKLELKESHHSDKETEHAKENVVIGQTRSIPPQDVLGTVKGRLTIHTQSDTAVLHTTLHVVSQDGALLLDRHFISEHVRESRWATLRGDERAIPNNLKPLLDKTAPATVLNQETFLLTAGETMRQVKEETLKFYRP